MLALRRQVGANLCMRSIMTRPAIRTAPMMFAQVRNASFERLNAQQVDNKLVDQRKLRPLSPELAIYKPQISWVLSGLHRVTGVAVGGVFYVWMLAYAAGLPVSATAVAGAFGALPLVAKIAAKFLLATPFTFHAWNGVRHLVWDMVKLVNNKGVTTSGQAVIALTFISSALLAFL